MLIFNQLLMLVLVTPYQLCQSPLLFIDNIHEPAIFLFQVYFQKTHLILQIIDRLLLVLSNRLISRLYLLFVMFNILMKCFYLVFDILWLIYKTYFKCKIILFVDFETFFQISEFLFQCVDLDILVLVSRSAVIYFILDFFEPVSKRRSFIQH